MDPSGVVTVTPGGWLQFATVNFGTTGSKTLRMNLATTGNAKGLKVVLRADQPGGPPVASLNPKSGRARVLSARTKKLTGVHDLYLTVTGKSGSVAIRWLTFQLIPAKKK